MLQHFNPIKDQKPRAIFKTAFNQTMTQSLGLHLERS
jgi:hypothetical protein